MKNIKINWNVFMQNSSESDIIADFAYGKTFKQIYKFIYSSDAIKELNKMMKSNVSETKLRIRAKKYLRKNSYSFLSNREILNQRFFFFYLLI